MPFIHVPPSYLLHRSTQWQPIFFHHAGIPAATLSEETREDLYQRVMTDTRRIKLKFSALQDEVWKSIKDIQGLVRLVLGMSMLSKDDEEQIRKTPSDVSIILTKYWSFLDFENLEHIVERKCSNAEKKMMKEYKEEVLRFCRRRVSELPPNSLGSSSNTAGMKKLCVTLDLHDPALQRVKNRKMAIANILGCRTSDLVLQNIEPGSVLATYLVNASIGAQFFERGITTKQKAALKANKVICMRYDETVTIFSADGQQLYDSSAELQEVQQDTPPCFLQLPAIGIFISLVFIIYKGITESSTKYNKDLFEKTAASDEKTDTVVLLTCTIAILGTVTIIILLLVVVVVVVIKIHCRLRSSVLKKQI